MAVKINFNEAAAKTHTALVMNERELNKSLLRLSTGDRILSAADDSAGLFIADMLDTMANAYDQGNKNIQTGISALQIAETSAGKIYEKLQAIYVRAQNAANDINDPNARGALQREINNFIDAIQKIARDTEYNGIKLLDGTFTDKYIHYGPRANQKVRVDIGSLQAQDLGAYMIVSDTNPITTSGVGSLSSFYGSGSGDAWFLSNGEYLKINGAIGLANNSATTYLVDAATAAKNINSQLGSQGIKATAINTSRADKQYSSIVYSTDPSVSLDINFYIGQESITTPTFALKNVSANITIDEIVDRINKAASEKHAPLRAYNDNGHLVLKTTNGETIAIEIAVHAAAGATTVVNFDQLIEGASSQTVTGSGTAFTIKTGNLQIASSHKFLLESKGVSNTGAGLALLDYNSSGGVYDPINDTGGISSVTSDMYNLFSINVTTNAGAEQALLITEFSLQRVDTVRATIGAVMNNLQSIWDAQKVAYDNTKEAESVIKNTDYAAEMSKFTTYQIRMQSTIAMLAQANQLPQLVLQLLK